eukprot:4791541-Pleurochrysis_carterae.AAC.1
MPEQQPGVSDSHALSTSAGESVKVGRRRKLFGQEEAAHYDGASAREKRSSNTVGAKNEDGCVDQATPN